MAGTGILATVSQRTLFMGKVPVYNLKRRWQIAFRRFILKKHPAKGYSDFYGITQDGFRKWIEVQFAENMTWDNYGKVWDFDHRIPACYFDYYDSEDLVLFWNFLNVRPAIANSNRNKSGRLDIQTYYSFFKIISQMYNYDIAYNMVIKIEGLGLIMKDPLQASYHSFLNEHRIDWENFFKLPNDV